MYTQTHVHTHHTACKQYIYNCSPRSVHCQCNTWQPEDTETTEGSQSQCRVVWAVCSGVLSGCRVMNIIQLTNVLFVHTSQYLGAYKSDISYQQCYKMCITNRNHRFLWWQKLAIKWNTNFNKVAKYRVGFWYQQSISSSISWFPVSH